MALETQEKIVKQKQKIARGEQSYALLRLKERRAETRCKIEWGGLVVKSGLSEYPKSVILGALIYAVEQLEVDADVMHLYDLKGEAAFMGYLDNDE